MNKLFSAIAITLILTPYGFGQSIIIEDKIVTKAGRMASVTIKSDGKATAYTVVPIEGVDIFREYDPDASVIKLRLLSYANGTYYIIASTTLNDKIATKICMVQVDPIIPDPKKPDINSQLIKNLKAVYAADSSINKSLELKGLTALYEQGAIFVQTRPDLKTYGQVWGAFEEVAKTLGCSKKLIAVQQLIQNEMTLNGIPITPADGATAVDKIKLVPQLQRISNLLKQIE